MKKITCLTIVACLVIPPLFSIADPQKLLFSAEIEEKYSDNVYFDKKDTLEDLITRISPIIQGGWAAERTDIRLSGKIDFIFYRKHTELDAVDQSYSGNLSHQWNSRFSTSFSAGYLDDERPERELAETGLLFTDDRRRRQTYNCKCQYQLGELAALDFSYGFSIENFDDPPAYDLRVHTVQTLFTRSLSPVLDRCVGRLQLVGGQYTYHRDYDRIDPLLGLSLHVDDEQTIDYASMRLGLAFQWTERLQFTFDLGARSTWMDQHIVQTLDPNPFLSYPDIETKSASKGYVAMLEAVYAREKGQLSVMASHDIVPASGNEGVTERTSLRISGNERMNAEWSVNWFSRVYLNRSDNFQVAADINELSCQVGAGLRYAFNLRWHAGINWTMYWLEDREIDEERKQNSILIQLRYNWPIMD